MDVFSLISPKFHIIDLAHQLSFLPHKGISELWVLLSNAAIFLSILMPAIKLQIHDTVIMLSIKMWSRVGLMRKSCGIPLETKKRLAFLLTQLLLLNPCSTLVITYIFKKNISPLDVFIT